MLLRLDRIGRQHRGRMLLWRVAVHDMREAWRSRVIVVLGGILTLLVAGATVIGSLRHRIEADQRTRYEQLVASQWQAQPDRHPHRVSHYGFLVFRPTPPVGFVDTGVAAFTGTSLFLEAHRQNTANFSAAAQAGSLQRFGDLTPAQVVQLLAPLLVFATAGVSVTRERESGTLSLLVCQGASWSTVLWGKVAAAWLIVVAALIPGAVATFASALAGGAWPDTDAVLRASLLSVLQLLFLGVCATVAVAVSARHRTSRGALVTLVGAWVLLWVVVPRVLPWIATSRHPVPARAAFDADVERRVRELGDSHDPNDPRFAAFQAQTLARHGVSRVEDLPVNYNGLVTAEGERLTTQAWREHLDRLLATYRRQARLVEWVALADPYVAMRLVSMALAGVDVAHAIDFERQAEDHRFTLVQELNALHTHAVTHAKDRYGAGVEGGAPSRQRIDRVHFARVSTFDYRPPSTGWAASRQPFGLAALVLWLAGSALCLWLLGRRPLIV
jgi:ABC-2 type transport system permease protein